MQFTHFACGQQKFCGFNFHKWLLTREKCENKFLAKITNTMISIYLSIYPPIYHLSSITNSSFHLSVYIYTTQYSIRVHRCTLYSGCILTVRSDSWLKVFGGWCGKKGGILPHSHSCSSCYGCPKHGHLTEVRANCE